MLNPFAESLPRAAYIHVPFCLSKCSYCAFYSIASGPEVRRVYTDYLLREIDLEMADFWHQRREEGHKLPLSSLYFGGGTPSLLAADELAEIMERLAQHFVMTEQTEITLEANPSSSLLAQLEAWRKLGINRLSLGLQTSDDDVLKQLGRRHNYQQFLESYQMARAIGFTNISFDLIFGLPGQKLEDWEQELRTVLALTPDHLSFYSLQLEEGTPLGDALRKDPSSLPSEEEERAMYHLLTRLLPLHGLFPYEISNAARPGFESRHNSLYWRAEPYFAFGPAAASYTQGERRSRPANLTLWQNYIDQGPSLDTYRRARSERCDCEKISGEEARREFMLLGFRMLAGVSQTRYRACFKENMTERFAAELDRLLQRGLIEQCSDGDHFALSLLGRDLANQVFLEFV